MKENGNLIENLANTDIYSMLEDSTLKVTTAQGSMGTTSIGMGVLSNDSDVDYLPSESATLVAGPANGTLAWNGDGKFTYKPAQNFNGVDSFTYRANDNQFVNNLSNVAMVTITV